MPKKAGLLALFSLYCALSVTWWVAADTTTPNSPIIPGQIRTDATFEHIGVLWWIEGDSNLNSQLTIAYREQGSNSWQPGALAMRADPTVMVNGEPLGLNYWGASALFLEPGTTYELQLTLTDPDGGSATQTVVATTRSWPQPATDGRHLYVMPGSGGGDGSAGNPFQGLQAAADAAQPGDLFHIGAGTYEPFQLLTGGTPTNPITFRGPADGTAVLAGNNTDRGIITLGEWDQTLGHVIITGLTLQNGAWGVDAQHTHDIYLHHNLIQDVDFGIYNRRQDGLESNQTICDNIIHGRVSWPGTGIPGERGIDLRGTGNVVCHNEIRNFGDCVSVQPFTGPSYGNDVFGNDAAYCVDDGLEIDYNQANVRVWRNRVMNARMGSSVQPIAGGPAYIFRNEFFNLENQPIKMNNQPSGFIVIHNTAVKHGNGLSDPGEVWRNAVFRNNLMLGTRYAFEFTTIADDGFRDFDYNAWGTSREIGNPTDPYFKWDNVRYDRLEDLPPAVEDNGVEAFFEDLLHAPLPPAWDSDAPPGSRDLRLTATANAVDAGTPLANLNDPFTINGLPDMGAFELGEPLPHYGPRPQVPDFSASAKTVNRTTAATGEQISYTITLRNTGAPLTTPLLLTDTLPAALAYEPGSLTATAGTVDDSQAPTLLWSGSLTVGNDIIIHYLTAVIETEATLVTNTAVLNTGIGDLLNRSATVVVNGQSLYLPMIHR